jgi:hypothetical protein
LCFDSTSSWKTGGNNFLFSLNKMKKYEIKEGGNSIYSHANYGPTFGGGHDLGIHTSNYLN